MSLNHLKILEQGLSDNLNIGCNTFRCKSGAIFGGRIEATSLEIDGLSFLLDDTKIEGDKITLQFKFPFHYKKINTKENINIITDTAKKVSGKQFKVECLAADDIKKSKKTDEIESINNIFGKTEVLES